MLNKSPKLAGLSQFLLTIGAALVLAFAIQAFVIKSYQIPSESMEPTVVVGQRVLVDRLFHKPVVGDVVVFHPPAGGNMHPQICGEQPRAGAMCMKGTPEKSPASFIKRIVGAPGDRLSFVNGYLVRNGKRLDERYARACLEPARCNFPRTVVVPAGHYYMAGDNRSESGDSRFFGAVPQEWIIGKAFATFWPPNRIGGV